MSDWQSNDRRKRLELSGKSLIWSSRYWEEIKRIAVSPDTEQMESTGHKIFQLV